MHIYCVLKYWKETSKGKKKNFIIEFENLLLTTKKISENIKDVYLILEHLNKLKKSLCKFKKYTFFKKSSGQKLLKRILKYSDEIFLFFENFRVPFTNNGSERDIRSIVIHRKISNCIRINRRNIALKKMSSIISTLKKKSQNIYEELYKMVKEDNIKILFDNNLRLIE